MSQVMRGESKKTSNCPRSSLAACRRVSMPALFFPKTATVPFSMKLSRWLCAGIAAALVAASGTALAETYPARWIRLIVPLAPGSPADAASRFIAGELSKALGQSVVVINKPGAGGTIAMAELARAVPDGYTIGFASQGILVFNHAIFAKPGYDFGSNTQLNQ